MKKDSTKIDDTTLTQQLSDSVINSQTEFGVRKNCFGIISSFRVKNILGQVVQALWADLVNFFFFFFKDYNLCLCASLHVSLIYTLNVASCYFPMHSVLPMANTPQVVPRNASSAPRVSQSELHRRAKKARTAYPNGPLPNTPLTKRLFANSTRDNTV